MSIIITLVLIWLVTKVLSVFTKHGDFITVPDFTGLKIEEVEKFADEKNLEYQIIDSVFNSNKARGTVIGQDPLPNMKVKSHRKIYLTVVARSVERVAMPNLIDLTVRQAVSMLETFGLKPGELEYVQDMATNAVLKQKYKGRPIIAGAMIEKGSEIDLVVGRGENGGAATIPFLYGKFRSEALNELKAASLNIGEEHFADGVDSNQARVYKQSPAYSKRGSINLGSKVSLWYKSDKKFDFNALLEKLRKDTVSE
ncbi:MAG: PASTA domain-containing protein [Bacteroidetes bacterium]|nr:PASTA domain-containing protein [Bacteroidota bacterium]